MHKLVGGAVIQPAPVSAARWVHPPLRHLNDIWKPTDSMLSALRINQSLLSKPALSPFFSDKGL